MPFEVTRVGILGIDEVQNRDLTEWNLVIHRHLLGVAVGFPDIEEAVPDIAVFEDGGKGVPQFLVIVSDNVVVGTVQLDSQGLGKGVIQVVLPVKQVIPLLEHRQFQAFYAGFEYIAKALLVKLAVNVGLEGKTGGQQVKVHVF